MRSRGPAPSPSAAASRAARARQAAGGAPGRWRHGRMPELWRCVLADVDDPRVGCGCLVELDARAPHLAAVHGRPFDAAAFVINNAARTTPAAEVEP